MIMNERVFRHKAAKSNCLTLAIILLVCPILLNNGCTRVAYYSIINIDRHEDNEGHYWYHLYSMDPQIAFAKTADNHDSLDYRSSGIINKYKDFPASADTTYWGIYIEYLYAEYYKNDFTVPGEYLMADSVIISFAPDYHPIQLKNLEQIKQDSVALCPSCIALSLEPIGIPKKYSEQLPKEFYINFILYFMSKEENAVKKSMPIKLYIEQKKRNVWPDDRI